MKQLKSHDFPEVYEWLGINLNKLGCVMLDLEPIRMPTHIIQEHETGVQVNFDAFLKEYLYYANNKERFWIDGYVADKVPHITLLYGLLEEAKNYAPHIEKVLAGWKLNEVEIDHFGYFDSPYPDEPYYCVVAHIKVTPELLEGHHRLEFLPHINTFAEYKPHMTIAYIKKDNKMRDNFIEDLKKEFSGKKMKVNETLNLGGNK